MMKRIASYALFILIGISVIFGCVSCHNNQHKAKSSEPPGAVSSNANKNDRILVKGDSLQLSINNHFVTVPKSAVVNCDSVYKGIYRINGHSIHQVFSIQINNIAYFTTQSNVGTGYRGYLYAFDLKKKKLLTNYAAKTNYVFSSGGIFFLNKECIFSVDYPNHQKAEQPFTTSVEVYKIVDDKFHYITHIDVVGEMTADDAAIIKLYNVVIKYSGKTLP